jgi:hypothetical protein
MLVKYFRKFSSQERKNIGTHYPYTRPALTYVLLVHMMSLLYSAAAILRFPAALVTSLYPILLLQYVEAKTLYKKTVQHNVDDNILTKQCFPRALR